MSDRKFKCSLYDLLGAGDNITGAAVNVDYAPRINLRLVPPYIADTVALILDIRTKISDQSGQQGTVDTLTLAQQQLVKAVARQTSAARETAKRAFKGSTVKLHDEFRVGQNAKKIGAILGDGRIVAASLKKTENLPALAGKGWLPADTQKLDDAIAAASDALKSETDAQGDGLGQTAFVNTEANDLYDRLLDIQNAADLEWPDSDPTNVAVRAKFMLGGFPYAGGSSGDTPPPTPPAPPATGTPAK
jgi:hypothetical protein